MSAAADTELVTAQMLAVQLNDQAAEEVAALVDFMQATRRSELSFGIPPNGQWKYPYERSHSSGYGVHRGLATVRHARLQFDDYKKTIVWHAGPGIDYPTAVEIKYGYLRDRMGGFQGLVKAIRKALAQDLAKNSDGRDEALVDLSAVVAAAAGSAA